MVVRYGRAVAPNGQKPEPDSDVRMMRMKEGKGR